MSDSKNPTLTQHNRQSATGETFDVAGAVQDRFQSFLNKTTPDISPATSQVVGNAIIRNNKAPKRREQSMSEILKDMTNSNTLDSLITSNEKIEVTMKDYDLTKRTLPQVYKILKDLITAIINPEILTDNNFVIDNLPDNASEELKHALKKLTDIDEYNINRRIEEAVEDYLIISRAYYLVTPYNALPHLLKNISGDPDAAFMIRESAIEGLGEILETGDGLLESATYEEIDELLTNVVDANTTTITGKELASDKEGANNLLEAALEGFQDLDATKSASDEAIAELDKILESFADIELISGPLDLYKDELLSEASMQSDFVNNASMTRIMKQLSVEPTSGKLKVGNGQMQIDKLEKMNIKGCFVEKLAPGRVVPILSKSNRKIGYFYVKEDLKHVERGSLSGADVGLFSSLNGKLVNKLDNQGNIPKALSNEISRRLLARINPRFVKENIKNIDEIFDFVNEFVITNNRNKQKVHFIHPDDIVEFARPEGSIMKYAVIMSRLAILLIVSNIIAKVTTGYDKTLYYMNMSLSSDIAQSVEDSINSIIDGRITMDSITSIENIFGAAGTSADVFIPQDSQGNKTIDSEIQSGQDIDMDQEFIKFLIDSILLSFGVEPAALDFTEDVNFAKTLSMVDLRIAKNALQEQKIVNPSINKLIKKILYYELGEDSNELQQITAHLQAPKIIILEMLDEIFGTVTGFGEDLSSILVGEEQESEIDKQKRKFKLDMVKKFIPSLEIDEFIEMLDKIKDEAKKEKYKDETAEKLEDGEFDEEDE